MRPQHIRTPHKICKRKDSLFINYHWGRKKEKKEKFEPKRDKDPRPKGTKTTTAPCVFPTY